MKRWPEPVTLNGDHVRLELSDQKHADDLAEVIAEGALDQLWYTMIPPPEGISAEIDRRLSLANMTPFTVVDRRTDKAIGMTTYMNTEAHVPRLEIGSTWLGKTAQRTPINTECKYLLLGHAFEVLNCIAVEFRTHVVNMQSRRAIERLGAKPDGILRNHMVMANGTFRDTAVYSVINTEWPMVKANLEYQIRKPR